MQNNNGNLGELDLLTIFGTVLGVANYEENLSQSQFQVAKKEQTDEIHEHLERQDRKIDEILEILKKGV